MKLIDKLNKLIPNIKQQKEMVLKNIDPEFMETIISKTSSFPTILNLRQRIKLIDAGNENTTGGPKCIMCNKEHFLFGEDKNISKYCSKKCRYSDKEYTKSRVNNVDQSTRVSKMKKTNLQKYGVEYQSQRPEVKNILKKSKIYDADVLSKLENKEWLTEQYKSKTASQIADEIGVYYGTVIDYLRKYDVSIKSNYNTSVGEKEILAYVSSIYNDIILNNHKINGFEADIFIPNKKLAIEYNGTYWHSSVDYSMKYKHIHKKELFNSEGIKLLQFTDVEWKEKTEIVKSMINSSFGIFQNKIRASECEIKLISNNECKEFCKKNHINGYSQSKINLSLSYKKETVMVISFAKPRFNRTNEYEIIRLCSKLNTIVYGGASKLFKYFISSYRPKSIMTYADLSYGEGVVYTKIGFKHIGKTEPGYFWVDSKGNILYRYDTMKKNLSNLFQDYNNESQREFMVSKGYKMYFNCGHNKYEYFP